MVADQSPSPNPYPASEVAAYDSSGRLVALVRPDRDAAFRIELPPGSYTLKAHPTAGNPGFAPRQVTVEAGHSRARTSLPRFLEARHAEFDAIEQGAAPPLSK